MAYCFALAGNPNSGKTTLFNHLTGSKAHVGNWPGVTVEKKEGRYTKGKEQISIVDLPGIYSLSPYTAEEVVARDYLAVERPDVIINIVDATNIERNLYLTTQLIELGIPVVVALNMMDEAGRRGDHIDVACLEKELGLPVVAITATKGQGVRQLIERAVKRADEYADCGRDEKKNERSVLENTTLGAAIKEVAALLDEGGCKSSLYYAVKLLERDEKADSLLQMDAARREAVDLLLLAEEKRTADIEAVIADLRYRYVSEVTQNCVKKGIEEGGLTVSEKIDKVVTSRALGIPIFFLVMYIVFQVSLGPVGAFLTDPFVKLTSQIIPDRIQDILQNANTAPLLEGLVIDGILAGIGAVLGFLPLVVLLFVCLSILEDIGYMARVAFVMDRVFRYFGLSGKAFVPLLMGYGCAVPAIMATRTLEDERSRRLAITLMPFMTCGARIPVYAVFVGAFFAQSRGLALFSIYGLGILVAMLSCLILNRTVMNGEPAPFIIELPPYRIPTVYTVLLHTWEKAKGYVVRVGTILVLMSIVIWFCQAFDLSLHMTDNPSESIFGAVGRAITPVFQYSGFGIDAQSGAIHWQIGAALLTGLVAKEAVVSTLGILYISAAEGELTDALNLAIHAHFTPLSAYSFMVFVLLYAPCFAAIATAHKELGSWKWTFFTIAYQCGVAWLISMLIYQAGRLLGIGI